MSKQKKEKDNGQEIPIDFQVESKNLNYTIVLRENEIEMLKKDNEEKGSTILSLESEISNLRSACFASFKSEKDLKVYKSKFEAMEKEVERLTEELSNQQKKFEQEKKAIENAHLTEVNRLKLINDSYHQKIEMVNQLVLDKELLTKQVQELLKEKADIIAKNDEKMRQKEVKNQIKFSNLKKKMMDNINQTQSKVTELNIQYMDVSTKLTLLQNHQLLIQLEYQSQQIDELTSKKEALEKKVFELSKDIEIHKEVELSLAEKNKKLRADNASLKSKVNNNPRSNISESIEGESGKEMIQNNTNISELKNNNNFNVISLEKKIYNLEKKLSQKNKEYNSLKDNSEYIELRLKTYEQKYAGLFNFFEESLRLFFEDEEIKNNKEIYVNIEALQHGDFTIFTKEEKYSILVILMKYLLPLVNSNECSVNKSGMNNINLKFHYASGGTNSRRYIDDMDMKKIISSKRNLKGKSMSSRRNNSVQNSIDSLPSIKVSKIGNLN